MNPYLQKTISVILTVSIVCSTAGVVFFYPRQARALGCPTYDTATAAQTGKQSIWQSIRSVWQGKNFVQIATSAAHAVWDKAAKLATWSKNVLLKILLHQLLAQLTNDIVDWIQNGGKPRFMTTSLGDYLYEAIDNAGGTFIDQFLGAGWLCEPFDFNIKIPFLQVPRFDTKARCTLSDMGRNLDNFADDFRNGGWTEWFELVKPQNNVYGAYYLSLTELEKEQEKEREDTQTDIEMGGGYLSPKDCVWYDGSGNPIDLKSDNGRKYTAGYKDVWGTPRPPQKCDPDPANPGFTKGGFPAPCTKRCAIITPASSVGHMANKAMSNIYDEINAQISGAFAGTGPFEVYITTIANALINKAIEEGLAEIGVLPEPSRGDIGSSSALPQVINPQTVIQNKDYATALTTNLGSLKSAIETHLLEEQKKNLAVLELIPPVYESIIPKLDEVVDECTDDFGGSIIDAHIQWAEDKKTEINQDIIPSLNARINEVETIDIPASVELVNQVDAAILSIQAYINKAEAWEAIYEENKGTEDNTELQDAELEMNQAQLQAVQKTQDVLKIIKATVASTDFNGLNQETDDAVTLTFDTAFNLEVKRGIAEFPEAGTLYAELETAQTEKTNITNQANSKINDCAPTF